MSYTALYRKYRPNSFNNVVGQNVIVEILKNSIKSGHISHAYLFTGPRGTGKTSIAKILAHAVNCQNFTDDLCGDCHVCKFLKENDSDIIEIDAASNNGVEEIRTIRDNVKLLPTYCKYKIYIIDEVHMLSTGAFNALLKTLEEPPTHVIFVLATTEPNKIPVTILSRCQRFDFNKIDEVSLVNRLKFILQSENRQLSDDVVEYISKISDGGLRDAINLLDQALSFDSKEVSIDDIDKISGKISRTIVFELIDSLINNNFNNILNIVNQLSLSGKSYSDVVNYILVFFRDYSISKKVDDYFDEEYSSKLRTYQLSDKLVVQLSKILNELSTELKRSNDQKLIFEIYLFNIADIINNDLNIEINNSQDKTIDNSFDENDVTDVKDEDSLSNTEEKTIQKDDKEETGLEQLKDIRINNVLAEADKNILTSVMSQYDRINDYISNKIYNMVSAILIEGKVVVASSKYLLFAFDDESCVKLFDVNYKQIETFLNEIYEHNYKVVAVTNLEWEKIRMDFINNKKNNVGYVFIEENSVELEVSDNLCELENSAVNIFGKDTISVK